MRPEALADRVDGPVCARSREAFLRARAATLVGKPKRELELDCRMCFEMRHRDRQQRDQLLVATMFVVRVVRTEIVYADDQRIAATFLSELRARVPEGETIYTWDNPGFFGFFSGRRIVDGDGLVNDHAYAQRLTDGTLAGYLDEERICYVVVSVAGVDPVLDVAGLTLRRADVEQLYVIRRKQSLQADYELHHLASERCARP